MSTRHLEIAPLYGKWALSHGGVLLATFATEPEAERAALAIARTQPGDDDVEVVIRDVDEPEASAA